MEEAVGGEEKLSVSSAPERTGPWKRWCNHEGALAGVAAAVSVLQYVSSLLCRTSQQ
jgi:hypothetical protein